MSGCEDGEVGLGVHVVGDRLGLRIRSGKARELPWRDG